MNKEPIKLLFYSDSRYYSGAEKVFTSTITHLAHDYPGSVVIMTPEIKKDLIKAVPDWEKLPLVWDFSATQLKLKISEILRLKKLIQTHELNGVLANMWSPYANTLVIIAAWISKTPIVTVFHYYQPRERIQGPLAFIKLAAYHFVAKLSHIIVTVSEAHKELLTTKFGFPKKKIRVIHNGIALTHPVEKKTFHHPIKLLIVGTLEEDKGQAYILPILAQLDGEWSLDIVGDGPQRDALPALAESLNLNSRVRFLGRRNDMEAIYADHDILVHPSYFENLSMAILEAMAHGLPVIAHDVGGNHELVHHTNGWLIPFKDNKKWLTSLQEAITLDKLSGYSQSGIKRWKDHFQLEQSIAHYKQIITELTTP